MIIQSYKFYFQIITSATVGSRTLAQAITFVVNIILCTSIIHHYLRTKHVTGNLAVSLRRKRMVASSLLVLVITMVSIAFSTVALILLISNIISRNQDNDGSYFDNTTINGMQAVLSEILSSINFIFYLILSSEFREKLTEVVGCSREIQRSATSPEEIELQVIGAQ